jgi:hypothetical protein
MWSLVLGDGGQTVFYDVHKNDSISGGTESDTSFFVCALNASSFEEVQRYRSPSAKAYDNLAIAGDYLMSVSWGNIS